MPDEKYTRNDLFQEWHLGSLRRLAVDGLQKMKLSLKSKQVRDRYLNIKKVVCLLDWAMDSLLTPSPHDFPPHFSFKKKIY
jgi:hypothetical protein